jgi:hypothetical protein
VSKLEESEAEGRPLTEVVTKQADDGEGVRLFWKGTDEINKERIFPT